ncbi:MAG: LysM peptidoglycan-binding domain-containing protein [Pirellulaceae bacterium]|nr:LysM peptidoglycan-binding domain-containing protein [Pirellulaceae bacterium]
MDTLKTAIVVVLLLAVLYGVYVTLNQPDQEVPEEIAWAQQQTAEPLQVDFGQTSAGAPSAVTASLGDSAPWSSDHAAGDMHAHDDTIVVPTNSAASTLAPTDYGQPSAPIAAATDVAAPDLITSTSGGPSSSAGSVQPHSAGAYASPPPPETALAVAPPSSSIGYDPANSSPSNRTTVATAVPQPPSDSTASVYGLSEPNVAAPAGAYGESSGLSDNPQVTATTELSVANSYTESAPSPSTVSVPKTSRIDGGVATARGQIEQGQYYEALLTLSFAYNSPGISDEERQQLQAWLDPLAGKVIYSKEHLVGAPYQVQDGETLQSIATRHKVPWQLLANINGLRDPSVVQPGLSIKVVPGPFHAEVDVASNSLTLFAGRLYAGKFAITVNANNPPAPGEYKVNDKQPGHSYYAGDAQTLGPQDPQNPYGGIWIDLGGNVSIHGTSSSPGQSEQLGCISLIAKDANDIYGILSLGSNVVIRR